MARWSEEKGELTAPPMEATVRPLNRGSCLVGQSRPRYKGNPIESRGQKVSHGGPSLMCISAAAINKTELSL